MNTKILRNLSVATFCILLAACSSTEYLISKKDGTLIEAYGKPKLDDKTGVVTYEDKEGRKATINKADVGQIIER